MKHIYFLSAAMTLFFSSFAQDNVFPVAGYVGIGTTNPQYFLQITGEHRNTSMNFHYSNPDPLRQADLTLWASEPGLTYTGAGIGNNVYNSNSNRGVIRINDVKGGSYIRLLDREIRLNIVGLDGIDISALAVYPNGNVGIGTISPQEKLSVNGKIRSHEVKVEADNWPDYVFAGSYKLPSLSETETFIKEKGHLPGIPTATDVKANGIDLGAMNAMLLKKIEELTLHLIEQHKESQLNYDIQQRENSANKKRLELQDDQIRLLKKKLNRIKI